MTEPVVEDIFNFTFNETDNSSIGTENSHQPYKTSNISYDFNIDLNKTFDLNKCDEHIKASSGIETALEPFNKYKIDCTNQKKNAPGKLSQAESLDCLESDESLGILPDLLKEEITFDLSSSELCSSNEIQDGINSEVNENTASLVFSPPSDSQFNRISLFLKNISTPLPNFVNDRRCSSTPKVPVTSQFVEIRENIEDYSSPHFLPDEKEEPITGSHHIKFETDFNLDDLKTVKPLASTYKTFSPPRLSSILNEWGEETDFRSAVNFKNTHETIENTLNVTQTFSHNTKDLFLYDNNQNVNILDNTFQIEQPVFVESANAVLSLDCSIPSTRQIGEGGSNNCSEKKKVQTLDSTFAIPDDEIHCNVDCEKTFVIDFNSAIDREISSKSICKNKRLNETYVFETDSIEFYSKQQEQIGSVTFTKECENDSQTSLEHCNYSHSTVFKPMTQILEKTFCRNDLKPVLEETFSEIDLNEMLARSKNVRQSINSENQSASAEIFNIKANVTFSEKVKVHPESKITQNDYLDFASPNFPKASNIFHEAGENYSNCRINLTKSEIDPSNKTSPSFAFRSIRNATFSEEIDRTNHEIEKCHEIDSTENVSSTIEIVSRKSPKALASTTFNQGMGGEICISDQINLNENDLANKMLLSVAFQSKKDATFSEEMNERVNQKIDKFYQSDSSENISSIIEVVFSKSPNVLASDTFYVGEGNIPYHSQVDHTENEYDPSNKLSNSKPLQSINDTIFSETNEKSCGIIDKSYERDSIQNKSSNELEPSLIPKTSKSCLFSDRFQVANILKVNAFQDSNCIEKDASNLQTIFPRKTAYSVNLNQCDIFHAETSFPRDTENDSLTINGPKETDFCTRSISEGDCHVEILPKSSETYENAAISENTDELRSDMDSNENDQVQLSQNSLKEMTDATFSEKTCKVQIEQISIQSEINEFETSLNSQNEMANTPFSGLAYEDVKPVMQKSRCDQDSLGEMPSNFKKWGLKDTFSRKATDVSNSSLKSRPFESKIVVKNGLMKPTKVVYPKKVSEQSNGLLPVTKTFCQPIDRRSSTSDFNCTLNLSDNSTHKSLPKNFNRRLTLSCSAESDTNNSKCKKDFKRSFGIPSKLDTKRRESYFQKSRLDSKYSNEYLKDINTINGKQNLLLQPNSISSKDPTLAKSIAVAGVNAKEPISSRLSLHGKLPLKSLKMKQCGLKSNAALSCTAENSNNKVISCPKVVDQPGKEKIPGNRINNFNSVKNYSKNSVGTNLPRKLITFSSIPNRTCNSKSVVKQTVIKQKSAPASNSCKPNSLKPSGSINVSDSNTKLKFSSLPKVQPHLKISSDRSGCKGGVIKRPTSLNKKSDAIPTKPCTPEYGAVQCLEIQSTDHVKQENNLRESNQPTISIIPSREQCVQPSNSLNFKKSNGQCNFLPMPRILKGVRSGNTNVVPAAQESDLHNQVRQQTSGKLPQLRKILAPRCNK